MSEFQSKPTKSSWGQLSVSNSAESVPSDVQLLGGVYVELRTQNELLSSLIAQFKTLNSNISKIAEVSVKTLNDKSVNESATIVDVKHVSVPVSQSTQNPVVEDIRVLLGTILSKIEITEVDEGIKVRPLGYLQREEFISLKNAMFKVNGKYVSDGKNSYYIVSRGQRICQSDSKVNNVNISNVNSDVVPTTPVEFIKYQLGELQSKLNVEVKGEYVVIEPLEFLGSENFSNISAIVRKYGGNIEVVSGKSFFKVPVSKCKL